MRTAPWRRLISKFLTKRFIYYLLGSYYKAHLLVYSVLYIPRRRTLSPHVRTRNAQKHQLGFKTSWTHESYLSSSAKSLSSDLHGSIYRQTEGIESCPLLRESPPLLLPKAFPTEVDSIAMKSAIRSFLFKQLNAIHTNVITILGAAKEYCSKDAPELGKYIPSLTSAKTRSILALRALR